MKKHLFKIPIGDWSGDGHKQCEYFTASATKPIEDVREAYFAAKKKYPQACPESFCAEYEAYTIDATVWEKLKNLDCPVCFRMEKEKYVQQELKEEKWVTFDVDSMVEVVIWFLNLGDPELKVKLENDSVPSLTFYGNDKKKRHIGFIGYGLLGD